MTAAPRFSRRLRLVLWLIIPCLGITYQYCAEQIAHRLTGAPFDGAWLMHAFATPWAPVIAVTEAASFAAWMIVLSDRKLSGVFPLTAISYLAVIAMAWFVFHEPFRPLTLVGGVAIMAGVWLLSHEDKARTIPMNETPHNLEPNP